MAFDTDFLALRLVIRGDTAASVAFLRLSESYVIAVNYRYSMRFYITALSTLLKEKKQPFARLAQRVCHTLNLYLLLVQLEF